VTDHATPDINSNHAPEDDEGPLASDPKIRLMAKSILGTMRAGMVKAAAHQADPSAYPLPNDPSAVEHIFAAHLRSRRPEVQAVAVAKAKALLSRPSARQAITAGGANQLNLRVATPIEQQALKLLPDALRLDASDLQRLSARLASVQPEPTQPTGSTQQKAAQPNFQGVMKPRHTKLALLLRYVQCKTETKEAYIDVGSDHITLGGVAVDASANVSEIKTFTVRDDFSDEPGKSVKEYKPPKPLIVFNLSDKAPWPKRYQVSLLMAEKDNGGMPAQLKTLLDRAKKEAEKRAAGKIGEVTDSAVWTAVLTEVMKTVITGVGNLLVGLWEDDAFPVIERNKTISSFTHVFDTGTYETKGNIQQLYGSNGHYVISTNWQLLP
jgi:hypothetical protein